MRINGYLGVSLIDFPGKVCSIVYTSPCNFRCPFCHNLSLISENPDIISPESVMNEISERKNFIDAVTVTGGEPTVHKDLPEFLAKIKSMGLLVKLDTNGYLPGMLKNLITKSLVDYFAMDIKSSPSRYSDACGRDVDISRIKESVDIIINSGAGYEFRTTVVPGLVSAADIKEAAEMIKGASRYIIQQFDNKDTFMESYRDVVPFTPAELKEMAKIAGKYVEEVRIGNEEKVA